jgi:hypothetical protein
VGGLGETPKLIAYTNLIPLALLKNHCAQLRRIFHGGFLAFLSPKFLVGTVSTDILIKADDACRDLVDEAKNYLLLPQERPLMQGDRWQCNQ